MNPNRILLVAVLPLLPLIRVDAAAAPQADDCVSLAAAAEQRDAERRAGTRAGTPSAGFHGMTYGGQFVMENGTLRLAGPPRVQEVICGSPAHRAGVRTGDLIISVNGRDPGQSGALAAHRAGLRFDLRVRRGSTVHSFSFVSVARPAELVG